jgi:hypothetical protein
MISYQKIVESLKLCSELLMQGMAYLRLALHDCLHTHLNTAGTEISMLTLGLMANPTNFMDLQVT